MPADRRKPQRPDRAGGRRPAGRSRPTARSGGAWRGRPGSAAGSTGSARTRGGTPASSGLSGRLRPRLTGRAAVLVLVLAVLAVSYASSMRAYLQQRAHIGDVKAQIAERRENIADLQSEKERWDDPAFVAAQARQRFGYVKPGETSYVVLDEDGEPVEPEAELTDPDSLQQEPERPIYADVWDSVVLAGSPPRPGPPPLSEIGRQQGDGR